MVVAQKVVDFGELFSLRCYRLLSAPLLSVRNFGLNHLAPVAIVPSAPSLFDFDSRFRVGCLGSLAFGLAAFLPFQALRVLSRATRKYRPACSLGPSFSFEKSPIRIPRPERVSSRVQSFGALYPTPSALGHQSGSHDPNPTCQLRIL